MNLSRNEVGDEWWTVEVWLDVLRQWSELNAISNRGTKPADQVIHPSGEHGTMASAQQWVSDHVGEGRTYRIVHVRVAEAGVKE